MGGKNHRVELFRHAEGGLYELVEPGLFIKDDVTGAWVSGVLYRDADVESPRFGQLYATTHERWRARFEPWQPRAFARAAP